MSDEEQEQVEREGAAEQAPESVRRSSANLMQEQIHDLTAALDKSRVKTRDGRGGGKFEYIAAHDAIRTANRIFGFGRWGYDVVEQAEIGALAVESSKGKPGWHVAWRSIVRLHVAGCTSTTGTGYGDNVEYTPAARLTAAELAIKESESDALKRALKNWGDQFGLILYAKEGERRALESDQARDETAGERIADNSGALPVPRTFAQIAAELERMGVDVPVWTEELAETLYGVPRLAEVARELKDELRQKLAAVVLRLDETTAGREFPPAARIEIQQAFAGAFDGLALKGPPWRLGPGEDDRPSEQEYLDGVGAALRSSNGEGEGSTAPTVAGAPTTAEAGRK